MNEQRTATASQPEATAPKEFAAESDIRNAGHDTDQPVSQSPAPDGHPGIRRSEAEWRALLDDDTYRIAREGGTERAFSGRYWDHHEAGSYHCACCGTPLFDSDHKYESGSGWPSYWQPVDEAALSRHVDASHGMLRTEICCARCEAHLGHVFEDGPQPTGLRYCINSASLRFEPQ